MMSRIIAWLTTWVTTWIADDCPTLSQLDRWDDAK